MRDSTQLAERNKYIQCRRPTEQGGGRKVGDWKVGDGKKRHWSSSRGRKKRDGSGKGDERCRGRGVDLTVSTCF